MKPGRELDALVAEKVMGLTYDRVQAERYNCYYTDTLSQVEVKNYSTDIAAAWQVVERLDLKRTSANFTVQKIERKWKAGWLYGGYDGDDWEIECCGDTAPHAICLAALKAVGWEG